MNKIRINELARQLEIPSHSILDMLAELGVTEKKTHSSSIEVEAAVKVREHFRAAAEAEVAAEQKAVAAIRKVIGVAAVHRANHGQSARHGLEHDVPARLAGTREDEYVSRGVVGWQFGLINKTREAYPAETQALNERLQLGLLRARAYNRKADGPPDRTHCSQSAN